MAIKAVIFVLDGTIVTLNLNQTTLRAEVRNLLAKDGMPTSLLSINESVSDMLNKVDIFVQNSGKSKRSASKIRRDTWDFTEKFELEAATTARLLPSVTEVLGELKRNHLKIGLITVLSEKTANYILKRFRLTEFFNAITPRDKVKNVKPNAEHLKTALKELRVKPEEALLISDDRDDLSSAKELKVISAEIAIENPSSKELVNGAGNYFIDSVSEIPNLIKNINRSRTKRK